MHVLDKYKEYQKIANNYINALGIPSYNNNWHLLSYNYRGVSVDVKFPTKYDFSINPKGIATKEFPNNMDNFQYGITNTQSHDTRPKLFNSINECITYIDAWKDGKLTNLNP